MVSVAQDVVGDEITEQTVQGMIRYLIRQKNPQDPEQALLPLRTHYLFKNFEGIWTCSNAECSGVKHTEDRPPIGKLFSTAKTLCDDCGSRVLELWSCQTCGDLFLAAINRQFLTFHDTVGGLVVTSSSWKVCRNVTSKIGDIATMPSLAGNRKAEATRMDEK